jgi:hypothetical protein
MGIAQEGKGIKGKLCRIQSKNLTITISVVLTVFDRFFLFRITYRVGLRGFASHKSNASL